MAVVYITEFERLAREEFGTNVIQTPLEPALAHQTVAIGASSVNSATLDPRTRLIRLHTDAICHIDVGESPSASVGKRRFPANAIEYVGIPAGVSYKIAVITGT